MDNKIIDDIVWYIPFKKLRNSLREFMKILIKDKETIIQEYLEKTELKYIDPIGFYESPYPPAEELVSGYKQLANGTNFMLNFMGLNMNDDAQLDFYQKISVFFDKCQLFENKTPNMRYYYNNQSFNRYCATLLYSIINYIKPNNIIEIGSGYSTALMLDINQNIFNNKINILSIEPNTERLESLLFETDNIKIIKENQQEVPLETFSILEENDILFIDSSHVTRPFSDVNRQFFEILPSLKKGVIIHMHDIFYPFEYPKEWILDRRRALSESYILRAFLQYNDSFEILFFPDYLSNKYPGKLSVTTQAIWLKKIK